MANILILGGGFGGLVAAERLAQKLDLANQITLVSPSPKFTFYPGLVNLAFGECEAGDLTFNLMEKVSELGLRFVKGEAVRVNTDTRHVQIAGDDFSGEIAYDYLLIATGRRLATEKIPGFFEFSHHLLGVNAALEFGQAINGFTEGQIIVGMCPGARLPVPVCETAFALAKRFRAGLDSGSVHIKVIFPSSLEVAFGGASLHRELEAAFARNGINVLYDVPINGISPDEVTSSDGHRIKYDLLMMVPPFRGHALFRQIGATDEFDFIEVDSRLRVPGLDKTYAVGDITAFPGPKFAHMAARQAETAAANIIAELNGKQPEEVYYHEIATIIDAGGPDSIYLHYGIEDGALHSLRKGKFWGWAKEAHDAFWKAKHK